MYNFDEIIDRRHTNAMNTDGFRDYIFHADETMKFPYQDEEFIRMWVADMEFATVDHVTRAYFVVRWSVLITVIVNRRVIMDFYPFLLLDRIRFRNRL